MCVVFLFSFEIYLFAVLVGGGSLGGSGAWLCRLGWGVSALLLLLRRRSLILISLRLIVAPPVGLPISFRVRSGTRTSGLSPVVKKKRLLLR